MRLIERVCPPVGDQDDPLDWPWWVPIGLVLATGATTLKLLADRHALLSPGPETVIGVLTVSPWPVELWLAWRRGRVVARPAFAAVVIVGVTVLLREPTEYDFAPFLLVAMVVEVAVTASLRVTAGVTAAAMAALAGLDVTGSADGVATWIAGVAASGALGALLRSRLLLVERERAVAAGLAERAVTEERQRIAREVHDVIAHSLSVTMLHVTGTRHLLETEGDVDEAVAALRDAERLGRQAMSDIRRTVGLLGQAAAEPTVPMPGLADLDDLVADFRAAGMEVDQRLVGDPAPLSLATGLGLYRIAQESLANVAKHAPGARTAILVDVSADPLLIRIRNGPPATRSGPRPGSPPRAGATDRRASPGHPAPTSGSPGGGVVPRPDGVTTPDRPAGDREGPGTGVKATAVTTAAGGESGGGYRPGGGWAPIRRAGNGPAAIESVGGGGGGLGLHGMRQRAELLGGELRAGPDGGGWCVEVVVPRSEEVGVP